MSLRPYSHRAACILAIVVGAITAPCEAADEVKLGGTGNAIGAMQLLADAFGKQNPDVKVTVVPSLGSGGAIKAVLKDALDVAVSARQLEDDERKLATSFEYARTLLVFAVASKSKVTAITIDEVADIYAGKLLNWPDGTPIRIVMRQRGDDLTLQLNRISPRMKDALSEAEKRPGMPLAMTDQETADKIESIPGALGVSTLSLVISENRPLGVLKVDSVDATVGNARSGKYPYVKSFFMVTKTAHRPAVQQFVEFVQSSAGKGILARSGHWVP